MGEDTRQATYPIWPVTEDRLAVDLDAGASAWLDELTSGSCGRFGNRKVEVWLEQRRAHVPRPARADRACGLQAHRFPRPSAGCCPSRRHRCSRRKVRGCNDGGTRDADGRDSALRPRSSSAVADARATTRIVGRKIRPPRTANRERTGRSRPDALRWSSQLARRSEHANQTTDDDASRRQPRHRTQEVAAEDRLATSKLYSLRGALAHER